MMVDSIARDKFIKEVDARLRMMFSAICDGHQYTEVERARLSGFMQAGVFLGLASKRELDDLMAQTHLDELGETIEERRKRKGESWREENPDFSVYESPAYERNDKSELRSESRARVPVQVGGQHYPNFKEALRAAGVLGGTTSSDRTGFRKELKAGRAVRVGGVTFEPVMNSLN